MTTQEVNRNITLGIVNDTKCKVLDLFDKLGIKCNCLHGDVESIINKLSENTPDVLIICAGRTGKFALAVCRAIRNEITLKHLPVVFISQNSLKGGIRVEKEAFVYGCIDYIQGPQQLEEVEAKLQTYANIGKVEKKMEDLLRKVDEI